LAHPACLPAFGSISDRAVEHQTESANWRSALHMLISTCTCIRLSCVPPPPPPPPLSSFQNTQELREIRAAKSSPCAAGFPTHRQGKKKKINKFKHHLSVSISNLVLYQQQLSSGCGRSLSVRLIRAADMLCYYWPLCFSRVARGRPW
jgi:hypothetical protein